MSLTMFCLESIVGFKSIKTSTKANKK